MVCLLSDCGRDNPRRCFLSKEALATGSPFSPEEIEDENQNKDEQDRRPFRTVVPLALAAVCSFPEASDQGKQVRVAA